MTKEEKAVYEFENILGELGSTVEVTEDLRDACRTAIETLQRQPCEDKYLKEIDHLRKYIIKLETQIVEQETCEDCIDREAVLKIYDEWFASCNIADKKESPKSKIKALPPVTPQQKTGHWIFVDKAKEHARCSKCGYGNVDLVDGRIHNYCEKCGTRMAEPPVESEEK